MKLFVTDYDGTLFVDDTDFKKNIMMLKKLQQHGFKIMISTGRSFPSIKNQVIINNIPYDYLSCADGSIIYDKDDNILKMFIMDQELVLPFQMFYQKLDYKEIQFSYPEGYYSSLIDDNNNLLGINVCIENIKYTKPMVNEFLSIKKKYHKYNFLDYMHTNLSYLCIKPYGITKSSTVDYLLNELKLNKKDIYIIGDSDNDYEMIKKYHGVCIENSCDEILKIAKAKYINVSNYIEAILKEDA